jgi:glycolate oxidase subunit GlcD
VDTLFKDLRALLGNAAVLTDPDELLVYECDGLPQHKYRPQAVVFPASTEETAAVMKLLARHRIPFTPRGAGTGLSGGALALTGGVVVEFARMRKILEIDEVNRIAVVQPGVVNLHVSRAVAHLGLHYVPDPSSQPTCTIGGNISENAGGIHCLKYGTTTDHVLGLRVVLSDGEIVELGGGGIESPGYDLLGTFVGSEGTFGIATEATLKLVPIPPAVRTLLADFPDVNDASHAVSAIIAAGIMPAALEMMDHEIIRAVEASVFAAGLPLDAGAALLIELDGVAAGIDEEAGHVRSICLQNGARDCRLARDENERKKLWAARKGAFGAIGRIAPDSMIQDAVVPRSRLPEVLASVYRIASKYQLRIANVFHAGDGNLHPLICFDSRSAHEVENVKEAGRELMETCVRAGGSITGEHGVGFDKRDLLPLIFSEDDMNTMLRVRAAFDPLGLCNPGKIIPMLRGCGEARAQATSNGNGAPDMTAFQPQTVIEPQHAKPSAEPFDPDKAQRLLADLVGSNNVSPVERALAVSPDSIPIICEVMKQAHSRGWKVMPGGSSIGPGHRWKPDIILSTRRLNQIIEHEPADLIAVAQAGLPLTTFNDFLKQRGQWLPLDPPNGSYATLGGVVACGLGGAQQFGYGPPRRHVIGMQLVLADGTLIKAGGKVVKNVAGYDLCKLFTGSRGSLGTIVELNFKLRPVAAETKTLRVTGDWQALLQIGREVISAHFFPVAVELLSVQRAHEVGLATENKAVLLIRFAGVQTAAESQSQLAARLCETPKVSDFRIEADDEVLWNSLAEFQTAVTSLSFRVSLLPGRLNEFMLRARGSIDKAGILWQMRVGDGLIRFVVPGNSLDRGLSQVVAEVQELTKIHHGRLTIETAPDDLYDQLGTSVETNSAVKIMERIKQQLDPAAILPPIPV